MYSCTLLYALLCPYCPSSTSATRRQYCNVPCGQAGHSPACPSEWICDGASTVSVSGPQLLDLDHRHAHGFGDLCVGHAAFSLLFDYPVYFLFVQLFHGTDAALPYVFLSFCTTQPSMYPHSHSASQVSHNRSFIGYMMKAYYFSDYRKDTKIHKTFKKAYTDICIGIFQRQN